MRGNVCAASSYSHTVLVSRECTEGWRMLSNVLQRLPWTFKIFTPVHTYWRWKPCVNEGGLITLVRFSWALWQVRYCWNPGNMCSWLKQGIRCAMRTSPPYTQSRVRQPAGCPWHHLAWGAGTLVFPYHLTAILTLPFQAGKLQVLYFCPKSRDKWNMYHLWAGF